MPEISVVKFDLLNYEDILSITLKEVESELSPPPDIPGYFYSCSSTSWDGYIIGLTKRRSKFVEFLLDQVFPFRNTIDIPFGHLNLQLVKNDTPILYFMLYRESSQYEDWALLILKTLAKKLPFETRIKLVRYKW
jgi:hypothetical protein